MFNTLKLDRETYEMQNIREAYDPVSARSSSHQACDRCHEKKLKCSGEKTGCDRCTAGQLPCRFTRGTSRGSRRGKHHNRHRSGEPSVREETPNPRSNTQRSRSWRSRSSQASIQSSSRLGDQTSSTKSTNSPEQHEHDDSEPMLDRIDPELFRLEDGFSFPDLAMTEPSYAVTSASDTYPHATMPTASTGHSAAHYQSSSGWFNSILSHDDSGYSDPASHDRHHEFDPYEYHDYRQHRWPVSESG